MPPPMISVSTLPSSCLDDADLVFDLRAAQNGDEGAFRLGERAAQIFELFLHQEARDAGMKCATPSVEAWARWAVPNASLT